MTVESAFMGGCIYFEYIYGWVWVFVTIQSIFKGRCIFLEDIYSSV